MRTAEQIRYDQSPESLTAEERKFYEHLKKVKERYSKSPINSYYAYLGDSELVENAKKLRNTTKITALNLTQKVNGEILNAELPQMKKI